MEKRNQRIGIVGLGRMGANMARHLVEIGHPVTAIYDVNSDAAIKLGRELDVHVAMTLAEVTGVSDVIITVVPDDAAMRRIFATSEDSLLSGAEGRIFINCGTVSPIVHEEIEQLTTTVGAESLEAGMASSITQAREGSLYLMVGGKESTFHKVEPLLSDLSRQLRYVGNTGKAAQVKILVNMVMNINTAGLAEGLALADALDLDLDMVREVFSQTGANSRVLETDGEDMQKRDHDCYFSSAHAAKDSGIALNLAHAAGLQTPLAKAAKLQYDRMVAEGFGGLDKSGVAELTFRNRGKSIPA